MREYTLAGACYAVWGGTPMPMRIDFSCVHCGEVFDRCTDIEIRRAYII